MRESARCPAHCTVHRVGAVMVEGVGVATFERWSCFARDLIDSAVQRDWVAEILPYSDYVSGAASVGRKARPLQMQHVSDATWPGQKGPRKAQVRTWMCKRVPPARLPRLGRTRVTMTAPSTTRAGTASSSKLHTAAVRRIGLNRSGRWDVGASMSSAGGVPPSVSADGHAANGQLHRRRPCSFACPPSSVRPIPSRRWSRSNASTRLALG